MCEYALYVQGTCKGTIWEYWGGGGGGVGRHRKLVLAIILWISNDVDPDIHTNPFLGLFMTC